MNKTRAEHLPIEKLRPFEGRTDKKSSDIWNGPYSSTCIETF